MCSRCVLPSIDKHQSWWPIVSIFIILALKLLYIGCICERKRNIRIGIASFRNDDYQPSPHRSKISYTLEKVITRSMPSIHNEKETFELNANWKEHEWNVVSTPQRFYYGGSCHICFSCDYLSYPGVQVFCMK